MTTSKDNLQRRNKVKEAKEALQNAVDKIRGLTEDREIGSRPCEEGEFVETLSISTGLWLNRTDLVLRRINYVYDHLPKRGQIERERSVRR